MPRLPDVIQQSDGTGVMSSVRSFVDEVGRFVDEKIGTPQGRRELAENAFRALVPKGIGEAAKQYASDVLPGGSLNPEVTPQGVLETAAISAAPVPVAGDVLGVISDLNRYRTDPESRTLGNFAWTGASLLPVIPAMTVWHGSPHKFDVFDSSKIGTGEGAQAYGHGLYLAESQDVARSYKRGALTTKNVVEKDGAFFWGNRQARYNSTPRLTSESATPARMSPR